MPHFRIPCLIVRQRQNEVAPTFALFAAPASQILAWAAIRRREDDAKGPQRRLSRAKINAIKRFLQLDERNTIPPAVTVTLEIDPDAIVPLDQQNAATQSVRFLEIAVRDGVVEAEKPGLVIDGQHRLIGISEFDKDCPVNVIALLNVPDMEKAFQFLVINNKATRVPSDLIRTLALDYQGQQLDDRLRTARLSLDENLPFVGTVNSDVSSPFRGHIALVSDVGEPENRFVPPAAIEASIALIQRKQVRELEGTDAMCEFFYGIWTPIKTRWPDLWNANSKLMQKVCIEAVTTFMTDALVARYDWDQLDVSDPDKVRMDAERIVQLQHKEFWTSEWTIRISDAKAVRDKIIESLVKVSRNMRADQPWHQDIDMIVLA